MISNPVGQGVILLGGHTHNRRNSNIILELSGKSLETLSWKIMYFSMKSFRSSHIAFPIPDHYTVPERRPRFNQDQVPVKDFTGAHVCFGLILGIPILFLFFYVWLPLISKVFWLVFRSCSIVFPIPDHLTIPERKPHFAPEQNLVNIFVGAHYRLWAKKFGIPILFLFFHVWASSFLDWSFEYPRKKTLTLTKTEIIYPKNVGA